LKSSSTNPLVSLDRKMTTSYQTWTSSSHIRHPWFDTTIMKRKHAETVSADEELDTHVPTGARVTVKAPPPKRRRTYSNLESGFAHMSQGEWSATASGALPSASSASYPSVQELLPPNSLDMDADMRSSPIEPGPIQRLTYTVEEPTIPEVTMKTSSWYEPEPDRIVITDMDSFTQSDEEEEGEEADLRINPVLLGQILTNGIDACSSSGSRPPLRSTSQALVLFKPLPFSEREIERVKEVQAKQKREAEDKQVERDSDSDAMDVEP